MYNVVQVLKLQRRPISPSVLDYLQSPLVVKSNFKVRHIMRVGAQPRIWHLQKLDMSSVNILVRVLVY